MRPQRRRQRQFSGSGTGFSDRDGDCHSDLDMTWRLSNPKT